MNNCPSMLFFENEEAKKSVNAVESGQNSLVIIKKDGKILKFNQKGINTLLFLFENDPQILNGAIIFDKVIGKAAACILILANVKAAYGAVISKAGHSFLDYCQLPHKFGKLTERILNRTGDDYCPIEKAALAAINPLDGYQSIKKRKAELEKVL